jgi:hypothetical protein
VIPAWIAAITAVGTFVSSITVSAFISGMRWGDMRRDIETVKRDVAEIKGMFTLTLKDK